MQDANDGVLDIVCGFSIIDDEFRLIVIEGLGGIGQAMQSIFAGGWCKHTEASMESHRSVTDIPREKENDKDLKILCNPEVLFPSRYCKHTALTTVAVTNIIYHSCKCEGNIQILDLI